MGGGSPASPASPAAPAAPNTATDSSSQNTEQSGSTTVVSAAPTAQPTQTLGPQGTVWVAGRLFISGSDTNSDCETRFKNIPTVQVWSKSPGQEWKLYYELSKPNPMQDDPKTMTAYQCGKFGSHFTFWGPKEYPCLNDDQVKFIATYKETNRKTYQGESPIYSCTDRENPPEILITLELLSQPMLLAPRNIYLLTN